MPAPEQTSIVFTGFMAAGKSRAARAAAKALGTEAIDTDTLIAERLGEPVPAFFDREGEGAFRAAEEAVVLEALDRGGVLALGGGAVENPRIRETLAGHVTAWCRVSQEVAWSRAEGSGRPLAANREEFRQRYEKRLPLYREVARVVLPRGGDDTPRLAAPWLAALRSAPSLRIAWARTESAEYPAVIGSGAVGVLDTDLAPSPGARLFLIADPAAVAAGVSVPTADGVIEVAGGEQSKTLEQADHVLGELVRLGVRRDDAIAAVGGGVIGDLAGFCAAVYQRGIPVVQVPTTLVAQVDSAYGGKTGVDLAAAKNYVGAYHQPSAVLADPGALSSLPPAELAAGFAEVVKTALIAGGELWERVRGLSAPTPEQLGELVFDCVLTKLAVVADDERDSGGRAVLNLGHTVGHAIEAASGYSRYRHGEAVALGLLAALRLSELPELRAEVAELLAGAGLPGTLDPDIDLDEVIAATARDKKRTAEGLGFVLVRGGPGQVEHGCEVGERELREAVGELRA